MVVRKKRGCREEESVGDEVRRGAVCGSAVGRTYFFSIFSCGFSGFLHFKRTLVLLYIVYFTSLLASANPINLKK